MSFFLFIVFLIPFEEKTNYFIDPAVVILYFPFLITIGRGAMVTGRWEKLCKFLGDISYPLYMIHYPFMWIFLSFIESEKPTLETMVLIILGGTIILITIAYLVFNGWMNL